ncbi:MAG: metallophosphoesterase family protein [Promethearchaeota archaeon]
MQHILCLADVHGNIKAVKTLVETLPIPFEYIIIAGDLLSTTIFPLISRYIGSHLSLSRTGYAKWVYKGAGRPAFEMFQLTIGRKVIKELQSIGKRIIVVPGNVDCHNVLSVLQKEFKTSLLILDGDTIDCDSFIISGIGGALPFLSKTGICDGGILEEDFQKKRTLLESSELPPDRLKIFLAHESPAIPELTNIITLQHCGSKELAKVIQKSNFRLVITGHYHERPGYVHINDTTFLNPGALTRYRFSVVTIHKSQIKVKLFHLRPPLSDFSNFLYSLLEHKIIK